MLIKTMSIILGFRVYDFGLMLKPLEKGCSGDQMHWNIEHGGLWLAVRATVLWWGNFLGGGMENHASILRLLP